MTSETGPERADNAPANPEPRFPETYKVASPFQFQLSSLLLVMTLFAVVMSATIGILSGTIAALAMFTRLLRDWFAQPASPAGGRKRHTDPSISEQHSGIHS